MTCNDKLLEDLPTGANEDLYIQNKLSQVFLLLTYVYLEQ